MQPETTEAHDGLPAPSAALHRFNPPVGTTIGLHPAAMEQPTRFGFFLGQMRLLITPGTHSEVAIQTTICSIPNVPSWFLGVMNLRGNVLPVFDMHQLLQMDNRRRELPTILLLDQGSDMVALPIDGFPQSVVLDHKLRNLPPLPEVLEAHVSAAYAKESTIWLDFDHQSFFTQLGKHVMS
jgi:chemotaxis signal transduction protein